MKIRPKIPIFQYGGNTGVGRTTSDWYKYIHSQLSQHILDMLSKYGEADDYGNWLNNMQHSHSLIRNDATLFGDWKKRAYSSEAVRNYQNDYLGNTNNQETQINKNDYFDYNKLGISNAFKNNIFTTPGKRLSGDNPDLNYQADGLYSSITDWRYLLGRDGDWNKDSEEYKLWLKLLNERGWETFLDKSDGYYKLRRLNTTQNDSQKPENSSEKSKISSVRASGKEDPESSFSKINSSLKNMAPNLLDALRLGINLHNNERVFEETMKGIRPNLLLSYHTHRQIVGDEATKLAYYRRAILGELKAAKPFTSDADRLVAYMNEAKRIGDELRAQGDLADNQEIRRTSDESNQHQWANTLRDTEIANRNIIELNNANATRHNLIALKFTADTSNWDNYLMGIQNRLETKRAEDKALDNLIWSLLAQEYLASDPTILLAKQNVKAAIKKHSDDKGNFDENNEEILEAYAALRKALTSALRKLYEMRREGKSLVSSAKSGTKLEYKHDDSKYLYKVTRDVVDHFRKMSKMADDSRIKSRTKPIKLSSHPKKMLQGGIAPFTIYRPLPTGGQSSTQTTSSGSSDKESKKDDKLDMVKELFKAIQGQGLPIDVNMAYGQISNVLKRARLLGEEMTTDDIASMYLKSMNIISNLKYSKERYDKAFEYAEKNGALNEFAVDAVGNYIVLDKDHNIGKASSLQEIKEKGLNPLTNELLLNMRAYSSNLAFGVGDELITTVINNGMGINKIGAQIKELAGSIGSTEGKLEGISQVESGKVKAGLLLLANTQGTPDGHYSITNYTKDLRTLILAALQYILNMLSPSLKAILNTHGGIQLNIMLFLGSQEKYTTEQTINPLTGRAASSKNGSSSGENDMLPSVAFFNGIGEKDLFIILDKTSDGLKINVISTPITSKGYNTGSITFDKLGSSDFGGLLLMNLATMGDSLISSTGRNNIIIDGRIYLTELPIDLEAKRTTGVIKPDLRFLKKIEAADAKLRQMGIDKSDPKNIVTVNKVYLENNLPILYTISNNKPTITSEYARFAIVNGVGTEDAFGDNPEFNDAILEISSGKERQLFETMMLQLGNSKYKLDNGIGILGYSIGETKLYKGTIYIPMVTSNISALAGTGFKAKGEEYNEIEARQQAANAAREMGFTPAGDASNLL